MATSAISTYLLLKYMHKQSQFLHIFEIFRNHNYRDKFKTQSAQFIKWHRNYFIIQESSLYSLKNHRSQEHYYTVIPHGIFWSWKLTPQGATRSHFSLGFNFAEIEGTGSLKRSRHWRIAIQGFNIKRKWLVLYSEILYSIFV